MNRFILIALILVLGTGCGVPERATVEELKARLESGDTTAAKELVAKLGRETSAEERAEAYRTLSELDGGFNEPLRRGADSDDDVLREHALALAGGRKLPWVRDEAVEALEDPGFKRKHVGAWVLGELGDPANGATLVELLVAEPSGLTAREAARALVKLGKQVAGPLAKGLPRIDGPARGYALRVLGELRDPGSISVIARYLDDAAYRTDAVWALGTIEASSEVEKLIGVLSDPDWRVRVEACRALGLIKDPRAEFELDRLRKADPEMPVREWAARSLGWLRGDPVTYADHTGAQVMPDNLYR